MISIFCCCCHHCYHWHLHTVCQAKLQPAAWECLMKKNNTFLFLWNNQSLVYINSLLLLGCCFFWHFGHFSSGLQLEGLKILIITITLLSCASAPARSSCTTLETFIAQIGGMGGVRATASLELDSNVGKGRSWSILFFNKLLPGRPNKQWFVCCHLCFLRARLDKICICSSNSAFFNHFI